MAIGRSRCLMGPPRSEPADSIHPYALASLDCLVPMMVNA
jgi:hypothetical protein